MTHKGLRCKGKLMDAAFKEPSHCRYGKDAVIFGLAFEAIFSSGDQAWSVDLIGVSNVWRVLLGWDQVT